MATPIPHEPGGDDKPRKAPSYADRAKMNIKFDHRLKRNVLEIEVEKLDREDEINLDQDCIAKLFGTMGLDVLTHVEGYQVNYGKVTKIAVLCKEGLDLERFCRKESIEVCRGVSTRTIRPAGRRDVTVMVSGLNFNTPDTFVQEYITKFGGKMISSSVIYGRHGDGPFKGKVNGDRKYQVDFTGSTMNMGTYHFLDGERIRVYFRGNIKTCGRCHQTSNQCPGGGIARDCQDKGSQRVDLIDHMKSLWAKINFNPTAFQLPQKEADSDDKSETVNNLGGDQEIIEAVNFGRQIVHPIITEVEKEKITSVRITNFPLDIKVEEALKFLKDEVSEVITKDDIEIERNERSSQVTLKPGLDKVVMFKAVEVLDFKRTRKTIYPGRPLYIRLLRPLTPEKTTKTSPVNQLEPSAVKELARNIEKDKNGKKNLTPKKLSAAGTASASTSQVPKYKQIPNSKTK